MCFHCPMQLNDKTEGDDYFLMWNNLNVAYMAIDGRIMQQQG